MYRWYLILLLPACFQCSSTHWCLKKSCSWCINIHHSQAGESTPGFFWKKFYMFHVRLRNSTSTVTKITYSFFITKFHLVHRFFCLKLKLANYVKVSLSDLCFTSFISRRCRAILKISRIWQLVCSLTFSNPHKHCSTNEKQWNDKDF